MDRKGKQRGNPESWDGKDVLSNLADDHEWQEAGNSLPEYPGQNHQPPEGSPNSGDLPPSFLAFDYNPIDEQLGGMSMNRQSQHSPSILDHDHSD